MLFRCSLSPVFPLLLVALLRPSSFDNLWGSSGLKSYNSRITKTEGVLNFLSFEFVYNLWRQYLYHLFKSNFVCLQRSEVKFQVSLVAQKKTRTKRARLRWVYFISCCLSCEVAEIGPSHCDTIGKPVIGAFVLRTQGDTEKQQLARASRFLVDFCAVIARSRRETS